MTRLTDERTYISGNGIRQPIGPEDVATRSHHESLIRADYERTHPDDTFDDLKHRAGFSKEDRGLLRDWMAIAAERVQQQPGSTRPAIAA